MTSHASHGGFHTQGDRVFEVFFRVNSGWHWWECDRNGLPVSEENPNGPFETSNDAFLNASKLAEYSNETWNT